MTDPVGESTDSQSEPSTDVDSMLGAIVATVDNTPGAAIGVTLLVGGEWISGLVVANSVWHDLMAKRLLDGSVGDGDRGSDAVRVGLASVLHDRAGTINSRLAKGPFEHRRICLVSARPALAEDDGGEGLAMRIRIQEVQGWTFGAPRDLIPPADLFDGPDEWQLLRFDELGVADADDSAPSE